MARIYGYGFDPNKHHRQSMRLKGYDYSQPGNYFVTICTEEREPKFGEIKNDVMVPSSFGVIAQKEFEKLKIFFPHVAVDVYVVMPNHVHAIISIGEMPEVYKAGDNTEKKEITVPALPNMVGTYKSLVAVECLKVFATEHPDQHLGKIWQRGFHDHVISGPDEYHRIAEYIRNNPLLWEQDRFRAT